MPTLAAPLDCAKLEVRNERLHQLGSAPGAPVTGLLYYNTGDNTFYWYDGSAWVSARGGASATPPATNSALGTVQLAGDLGGNNTATAPQLTNLCVTDAKVATANKDGSAGVVGMRTLAYSGNAAMPGIARLDQIAIPTADLNLNSRKITALAPPTSGTDAANKNYVDSVAQALDVKASCRAASVLLTNINLASPGATIDGVTMAVNDRVLVKEQSTNTQNGIYVWNGAAVAMTRATDADDVGPGGDVTSGMFTWITEGTTNADSGWILTTNDPITVGTTGLVFTQFSGAGQITPGGGLTKTGNTLDIGAGAGITVNADSIQISNNGVTNAMMADGAVNLNSLDVTGTLQIANGGTQATTATTARLALGVPAYYSALGPASPSTSYLIPQTTHGMYGNRAIMVQCLVESTGLVVIPDVTIAASGDVNLSFGASQSANTIRVILIGIQSGGSPAQPV